MSLLSKIFEALGTRPQRQRRIRAFVSAFKTSSVETIIAVFFPVLPLAIGWYGLRLDHANQPLATVLSHGDAFMAACAVSGPAMFLLLKKRNPETFSLIEIAMLFGLVLYVADALSYARISKSPIPDFFGLTVTVASVLSIVISAIYALYVSCQNLRSFTLGQFEDEVNEPIETLKSEVDFSSGGSNA
jgi:tellurite resistance protein TehA-like permease